MASPAVPTSPSHHLNARLAHPHYLTSALLTLPFPISLALHIANSSTQLPTISWAILATFPLVIASITYQRAVQKGLLAEVIVSELAWSGKVFNLCAFIFLRKPMGLELYVGALYALVWVFIGFVYPQPEYLGPNKMTLLTSEEFDETVAIVPPAVSLASSASDEPFDLNAPSSITELPEPAAMAEVYEKRRLADNVWRVVLFHADWIRKSRELEITLAHISNELTSPTLAFHLLTPDSAPSTFYDLDLPTTPTSTALPVIFLFHKGQAVAQLPRGKDELVAARRAKRAAARRERARKVEEAESSDEEGSDDEREVESEVGWERRRWDRSGASIEKAFRLRKRSAGSGGVGKS